jgi:hypothetical protein
MKRKAALAGLVAILLVLAGLYLWGPSVAPPGQAPLSTLSPSNFSEFTEAFDAHADFSRMILLLSPT